MKERIPNVLTGLSLLTMFLFSIVKGADAQTLFTMGDEAVSLDEFYQMYKDNIGEEKALERRKTAIDQYLNLFINYKLKLKAAEEVRLDTVKALKEELEVYRNQILKNYILDKQTLDPLIKELFERTKTEVKVSHILIKVPQGSDDVVKNAARKKIQEVRQKALAGNDFNALAKQYSQAPTAKKDGGSIRYFSGEDDVFYTFENAAYTTPVGQVSEVFLTPVGYHILKVENRKPSEGKIQVAHIFVSLSDTAQSKIENIHGMLERKERTFDQLVKRYSEDFKTNRYQGVLPMFGRGEMARAFEEAAFALSEQGEMSKPVKTKNGWHILRLVSRQITPSFEDVKHQAQQNILNTQRGKKALSDLVNTLKKRYQVRTDKTALDQVVDAFVLTQGKAVKTGSFSKPLFVFNGQSVSQQRLVNYINSKGVLTGNVKQKVNHLYQGLLDGSVLNYYKQNIEKQNQAFAQLMKAYRDGVYIFHFTKQKVWDKSTKDTAGLKAFYQTIADQYMTAERVDANVYTCKDEKTAYWIEKMLLKKKEAILPKKIAKKGWDVQIKNFKVERGAHAQIDATGWKEGVHKSTHHGHIDLIQIRGRLAPEPKPIDAVRGYVVSAYQKHLEESWMNELRDAYPVNLNRQVLEMLYTRP